MLPSICLRLFVRQERNNRLDVGLVGTAVIIALIPLSRYQPDLNEKTEEEVEMEPKVEEHPLTLYLKQEPQTS